MTIKIKCRLCEYESKNVCRHVVTKHNITTKEYKEMFPDALLSITPRQKQYWIMDGYTEEEAIKKVKYEIAINSCRNILFWIVKRGYSEEDAIKKVSENSRKGADVKNNDMKINPEKYQNIQPNQVGYWNNLGYSEE